MKTFRIILGTMLAAAMLLILGAVQAEVIQIDPDHTQHVFDESRTCVHCGWKEPGFWQEGELLLTWQELKDMGYVTVTGDGRLTEVSGNLDGLLVIGEDVTKADGNFYILFSNCPTLKQVWFPRTITELGRHLINRTNIEEVRLFCPITELGDDAFSQSLNKKPTLTSVWLPSTLKSIGREAFRACSQLSDLVLPDSVETLGSESLCGTPLTQINMPSHLKQVKAAAFGYTSIERIVLPPTVEELDTYTFEGSGVKYVDLSGLTWLKTLPDQIFRGCYRLEEVVLPPHLERFGWACFGGTNSLKRISLPDGFVDLGNTWMDDVEEMVWPVSLVDVTLERPKNLKSILYRGSEKQWKLCAANSKWNLSGVEMTFDYQGE